MAAAAGSMFMYGQGGSTTLPIIGTTVSAPVGVGVSCGLGSLASDLTQDMLQTQALAQTPAAKLVVGLGVAGLSSGYLLDGQTPGTFWENAALGALSYAAGDYATSKIYTSPGRIF